MARARKSAFTLVELLTVIALMVIIAGVLLPVFAHARERARQTTCLSNLRQVAAAHQLYVQDWDERFPDWLRDSPPRPMPWGPFCYWPEMLASYLRHEIVLLDPSFSPRDGPKMGLKLADYALLTWGPVGRGTHKDPYYRWAGSSLTLAEVARPPETFAFTDGWTTTETTRGFYVVRHSGGTNAGLLDGHVAWLPWGEQWKLDHDGRGFYWYHYASVDR